MPRRPKPERTHKASSVSWPVAYRWLATGTLVAYTAVGSHTLAATQNNAAGGSAAAADPVATLPVRRFDIAAGPLDGVLDAYQRTTGIRSSFGREALRSVQSPGVTGLYTPEQALKRLLEGTSLTYRFTGRDTIVLDFAAVQASVEVSGRTSPALPQYTAPLRDIPQTITVIPASVMEQQGATSLRDVLRNVPGLTITAGEGGAPAGDNLTLRGFSARNDIFVDGVRDLGPQSRDPFNLEQVEVIKGPSSAYTGRGSTGGVINLVSKTPGLTPVYGGTLAFGSDGIRRVTTDLNTPVRFLGERTAFRLNAVGHESGVAGRDVVSHERWGFAPSLAMGLGTPTRLTLGYYKLRQDNMPDYGIPWVTPNHNLLATHRDQPAPVPRDSFYGLKSRDHEFTGSDLATVRMEHDFSDVAGVRNQLRYGRSTRDSVTTAPRFASPDSLVINRNGPSWITEDGIFDNQTDLRAGFSTGRVEHTAVGGVALTRESNRRVARTVAGSPTTSLLAPNPDQPFTGSFVVNPIEGNLRANSQSVYAFDTVKVHPKLQFNGGFRFDRFSVAGISTAAGNIERTDTMLSLRAGAVYQPLPSGSVYFSYGTSLNPSLEGLSYQPADTTLEPEKTRTFEAGTKWDLLEQRLSLTAAVFRVEKTSGRTPGATPDDPPQVLDGRQRVDGVEFGAAGSLRRNWRVFSGYTLLDSIILESNTAGETGRRMINTPRHSVNVWTTYSLRRLDLGAGARILGKRYGNTINTRSVDGYGTFEAMASYPIHRFVNLRLNLYNLNDAYYFDRLGGGHLIPGAGRSAMISAQFHF